MTVCKLLTILFATSFTFLILSCGEGSENDTDNENPDSSNVASDIVINEILAKSSSETKTEWVELFNKGDKEADISNWSVRDSKDRDPFIIPAGTVIVAGGFLVVEYDETGENGFTFGLGNEDAVRLLNGSDAIADSVQWTDGDIAEDQSYGRIPDGTGEFRLLVSVTKGKSNSDTCGNGEIDTGEICDGEKLDDNKCTDLFFESGTLKCMEGCAAFDTSSCVAFSATMVINEVTAKLLEGTDELPDWIELFNTGEEADISGFQLKDSKDSNIYTFPEDTKIAKDGYIVVDQETLGFGFGSEESARLFDKSGTLVDETSWIDGQAPENKSWGRLPNGTGDFQTITEPTKESENL